LLKGVAFIDTAAYDGVLDRQLSETAFEIYQQPFCYSSAWDDKMLYLLPLYQHLARNAVALSEARDRAVPYFFRALARKLADVDATIARSLSDNFRGFVGEHKDRNAPETALSGRIERIIRASWRPYGFISGAEGDYYFNAVNLMNAHFLELSVHQEVKFIPGIAERGPAAESLWISGAPTTNI
jgi:hypothetical protein